MASFQSLSAFIDTAVRSRKYPEGTGAALKVALKLFENELTEEESGSLDVFQNNLDQIYRSVCQKNSNRFSMGSLATYKSRIIRVLQDYGKYGVDPTKMTNWNPKVRAIRKKSNQGQPQNTTPDIDKQEGVEKEYQAVGDPVNKYTFIDSGNGWQLSVKSKNPLTLSMKRALIDVFESFEAASTKDE